MNATANVDFIQEDGLPVELLPVGDIYYASVHLRWEVDGKTRGCYVPVGREYASMEALARVLEQMAASIRIESCRPGIYKSKGF